MGRTQVIVEGPKGEKCLVDLCDTDEQMKRITVRQLKKKIIEKLPETPDPDDISLIFIDKRLNEDDRTLSFYASSTCQLFSWFSESKEEEEDLSSLMEEGEETEMVIMAAWSDSLVSMMMVQELQEVHEDQ